MNKQSSKYNSKQVGKQQFGQNQANQNFDAEFAVENEGTAGVSNKASKGQNQNAQQ
ncbi:hypothetical protein [Paenibacillus marinisediminis]